MDESESAAVAAPHGNLKNAFTLKARRRAPGAWTAPAALAAVLTVSTHAGEIDQLASSVSMTASHMGAQVCDEGAPVDLWAARAVLVCVKHEQPPADRQGTMTVDRDLRDEQPQPEPPEIMVVY